MCFVNHYEPKEDQAISTCISHGHLLNQPQWIPANEPEIGGSTSQAVPQPMVIEQEAAEDINAQVMREIMEADVRHNTKTFPSTVSPYSEGDLSGQNMSSTHSF